MSDVLILDFIVRRQRAGAANAEINRELAILGRGYSLAKKAVTMRPDIPKLQEAEARAGFFESEQFEAVCRHLPAPLVPAFRFAYITGWRIHSEVFALPWRLVDFDAEEVRLEPAMTKNSEGRVFPFNEALTEILTAQGAYTDAVQRDRNMIVAVGVPSSWEARHRLLRRVGHGVRARRLSRPHPARPASHRGPQSGARRQLRQGRNGAHRAQNAGGVLPLQHHQLR